MIVKLITSVSNTFHCTFEKKTNTCSSARLYENAYMTYYVLYQHKLDYSMYLITSSKSFESEYIIGRNLIKISSQNGGASQKNLLKYWKLPISYLD